MIDYSYPNSEWYLLRRRLGLLLRQLRLSPPESTGPDLPGKIAELERAEREGLIERPFNYGDESEKSYLSYADGRIAATTDHTFYPRLFYTAIRDTLAANPQLRGVINFGAFFANVDATLALLNPEVRFMAVDLGPDIKRLNESMFAGKNISFIDSTIEPVVSGNGMRPTLLAHCKTAAVCYPNKIAELYKVAAENGVTHIVGVETTGFCLGTGEFYEFTDQPKPSAVHKSTMYVHNYPAMLRAAGYKMTRAGIEFDGNNYAFVFVANR